MWCTSQLLQTWKQTRSAFLQGIVGGYLIVPEGYLDGQQPIFYGREQPSRQLQDAMAEFLRRALLPDQPQWLFERLAQPSIVTSVDLSAGSHTDRGVASVVRVLFPMVLALVFTLTVFTGASQMGAAVVREKDQRAMEMIITSITTRELVVGKIAGMTLVSLTQMGIWVIAAAIAMLLATFGRFDLQALSIPWSPLLWALLLCTPAYFLYAVLAAGLGIIAGDSQHAQQLAGILGLLSMTPLWLAGWLLTNPDGWVAVLLTLFPLFTPTLILFRMALSTVPLWQLIAGFASVSLSLAGSVWLVARIFRAAMLLYGQTLHPRQIWQALRVAA